MSSSTTIESPKDNEKGMPEAAELSVPAPERSIQGIKWLLVCAGIYSSAFLFSLDNSIVADVQPKIIEAFGSIDKLPWLSVAFALGSASTTLVWATVFSNFDAKYNYIVSVILFEIGSALCGAANKIDVLIFGRALAGMGGAGLYLGVLTFLSAVTTPNERPIYIASMGLIWGGGSVLGPVIGGAFADSSATWRWSFYINLCVAALFAPVYLFILPSVDPQPGKNKATLFKELDFVGAILVLGTFCCGVTGLAFGGSLFAWKSATIIVLLCVSVVLLVLFVLQQVYCLFTTFERRLLPAQYFRSRTLAIQFFVSLVIGGPIFIPVYFIPLFFQFTKGDGALDAAVRLLPFMFMVVFFSLANGAAMGKDGHYAPWYYFASIMIIIGSALMYTVDENTSTSRIYGFSVILGIGAGCVVQTAFIVAQATVSRREMSSAIALINLAQIGGLVLSLTIANTIFLNLAYKNLAIVLPNADSETIRSAVSGTSSTLLKSLDADTQRQVLHAVVDAMSKVYALCIAFGATALALSVGMKWEKVVLIM